MAFDWSNFNLSTGWNPVPPGGAPGIGTSILGIPTQYLGDLGMGLLARSGPTKLPMTFGQRLGEAGDYANTRRDQGILNDARRMEIAGAALENQGLAQMQQWMMENPQAGEDDIMGAYTKFMPGKALEARVRNYMSPADKVQMQYNQAQLTKLLQGSKGEEAETVTTAASGLENAKTAAEASARLDKAGSVFAPGGFVESSGGLKAAAAGLQIARAVNPGNAKIEELYGQVNDAVTVGKATSALARGLQAAGDASPRSNFALQNIQNALASGSPWPAKRTALVQHLRDIFTDVETQGIQGKIPDYAKFKEFYGELSKQNDAWLANREAATQPPASTVITPQPGVPNRTAPGAVPGPTPTPVPTVPVGPPTQAGAVSAPVTVEPPPAAATLDQAVPAGKEDTKAVSNANGLAINAAGTPVFKRMVDAERANQAGKLEAYDMIIVNGRIVDLK